MKFFERGRRHDFAQPDASSAMRALLSARQARVPLTESSPRPGASLAGVSMNPPGAAGVVTYGGVLYHKEYDRAWQGTKRDETIQHMANDPTIGACHLGIEALLRRVDWRLDPALVGPATSLPGTPTGENGGPAATVASVAAARFVDSSFKDMGGKWPGPIVGRVLTYLDWGWSVLSVGYKVREGRYGVYPSKHDDGKIGWSDWRLIPQYSRYGWDMDPVTEEPMVLIQWDPQSYRQIPIPLSRCLHFKIGSRDNNPEGLTPLRLAYDAWYRKAKVQAIEAVGIERDLTGVPIGRVPGKDIEGKTTVFTTMVDIVTGIRLNTNAGVVISSDRDAETKEYEQDFSLITSGGRRAVDTDPVVRRYANELVTIYLANVMRTGTDSTGSFALSETQGALFKEGMGANLDIIGGEINDDAIPALLDFNDVPLELAPTLRHGEIENANLERLGNYLLALASAGLLDDTDELRAFVHEVAGLPSALPSTVFIPPKMSRPTMVRPIVNPAAKLSVAPPPVPVPARVAP